jgi:hypothetical protein
MARCERVPPGLPFFIVSPPPANVVPLTNAAKRTRRAR